MVYNGQEVGEPAVGASGFSGDDARTTIFDYWSLPELARWVNGRRYDGGRLSAEQRELRGWYGKLLHLGGEPAFARGEFVPLNGMNVENPAFGRLEGEGASGHWLYAFLRIDRESGQAFLVVANLHGSETLRGVRVRVSQEILAGMVRLGSLISFRDRLATDWTGDADAEELGREGLALPGLPPCSALYLELFSGSHS